MWPGGNCQPALLPSGSDREQAWCLRSWQALQSRWMASGSRGPSRVAWGRHQASSCPRAPSWATRRGIPEQAHPHSQPQEARAPCTEFAAGDLEAFPENKARGESSGPSEAHSGLQETNRHGASVLV